MHITAATSSKLLLCSLALAAGCGKVHTASPDGGAGSANDGGDTTADNDGGPSTADASIPPGFERMTSEQPADPELSGTIYMDEVPAIETGTILLAGEDVDDPGRTTRALVSFALKLPDEAVIEQVTLHAHIEKLAGDPITKLGTLYVADVTMSEDLEFFSEGETVGELISGEQAPENGETYSLDLTPSVKQDWQQNAGWTHFHLRFLNDSLEDLFYKLTHGDDASDAVLFSEDSYIEITYLVAVQ